MTICTLKSHILQKKKIQKKYKILYARIKISTIYRVGMNCNELVDGMDGMLVSMIFLDSNLNFNNLINIIIS